MKPKGKSNCCPNCGFAFATPQSGPQKQLNPKQIKFIDLYIQTGNITQSYISAGYKARGKSAENAASRLLGSLGMRPGLTRLHRLAIKSEAAVFALNQLAEALTEKLNGSDRDQGER